VHFWPALNSIQSLTLIMSGPVLSNLEKAVSQILLVIYWFFTRTFIIICVHSHLERLKTKSYKIM
jgi:hypothetical protein